MINKIFNTFVKDSNNKEVFSKSLVFFVFKIGGFFLGYLFTILITRNFGKSTYGLITLAFTVFMIFSVISKFGFDINLTRLASSGKYSKSQIKNLYFKSTAIAFLIASTIAALIVLNLEFISLQIFKKIQFSNYLFWAALAMPFWTVVFINAGIFRGFKKNTLFSIFNSFGRFGVASLLLLIYILFTKIQNPIAPMIIHLISVCILAIGSTGIVLYLIPQESDVKEPINFKFFFTDSFPIFISSAVFILLGWMDRLFLGVFEPEDSIALFDVSAKIALIIGFSLEALNSILAPKVSELYYGIKTKELQKTILFTAKMNSIISLLVFFIILLFSETILSIFGEAFKEGKVILIILSIGQLFNCLSGSVGVILQMTGNQKTYRLIMFYALILNLILNLILIKPYGVIGVAIATSSSMIIWNLIGVFLIHKKLSVYSFYLPIKKLK